MLHNEYLDAKIGVDTYSRERALQSLLYLIDFIFLYLVLTRAAEAEAPEPDRQGEVRERRSDRYERRSTEHEEPVETCAAAADFRPRLMHLIAPDALYLFD